VLGRLVTIAPKFPNAASELERAREEAARLEARVTELEKALAEGGNDLHVRRELAALYQKSGRLEDAIAQLDHVIGAAANDPVSLSNLAWLRAACPEDGLRDGEKAIELATRAAKITGWRRPEPLMVLAAAYAEAGRHGEARQTAEKALSLAKAGFPGLVVEIESRLKIHGREEPIRAPAER